MRKYIYSAIMLLALWSCSDDDNATAAPEPDITGGVTDVVKVNDGLTLNLSTDKVCYKPGETVTFAIDGNVPADAKVRYRKQSEVVGEQALSGSTWT